MKNNNNKKKTHIFKKIIYFQKHFVKTIAVGKIYHLVYHLTT